MKKLILAVLVLCLLAANANATLYDIDKDPDHTLYGNLSQNDPAFKNVCPCWNVACGPVAVTNSYRYLERKYPNIYDNSLTGNPTNLPQTAANLATLMNTCGFGTTYWDDLIWYKMKYIEARVPGKTIYQAQHMPAWNWQIWDDPAAAKPEWVVPIIPKWQFIWNELVACEDVEILINWVADGNDYGHYLTVKSFHWNDTHNFGVIDFDEDGWFDYIDPGTGKRGQSKLWQSSDGGILETDYNAFNPNITMVVSESIPEPATLLLFGIGGLLIGRRRK